MSWPLASFLIVGLVLVVGWLAYERKRPSARLTAVVAIMAALAALGRDAFAALPDVKPITAMTFIVGYALGPLPGFTVGALGMLVSNFMLGQGPYTPWQMAAWGMVGLGGAVLGRLSGRRLGRVPLALACGLSAFAAKEVMNLYTWTLGASHTPAAFLAVSGQALAYDVTDAVASFLFGLAFAPELARVLARMRVRMEVKWEPAPPKPAAPRALADGTAGKMPAILALLVVATALTWGGTAASAFAAPRARESIDGGIGVLGWWMPDAARERRRAGSTSSIAGGGWRRQMSASGPSDIDSRALIVSAHAASLSPELSFLTSSQNADGGFGDARGQGSSELYTAWAAMGLAAAGRNPANVRRGGHSVLDSLRGEASSLQGLGDAERTILAVRACGASAYSFAGRDLVVEVLRARGRYGSFDHQVNLTAFAVFALRAVDHSAGFAAIREAAGWIERQQNSDGGFGFGVHGSPSDVDDTAAALQALVDAGAHNARVLGAATGYLVRAQNLDGGYPQQPGGESNAQSTAWAVQGLIAAGGNPNSVRRRGSRSPVGYLESLLAPGGSVRYSRTGAQTPVWVTAQVLIALAGKTLPIAP